LRTLLKSFGAVAFLLAGLTACSGSKFVPQAPPRGSSVRPAPESPTRVASGPDASRTGELVEPDFQVFLADETPFMTFGTPYSKSDVESLETKGYQLDEGGDYLYARGHGFSATFKRSPQSLYVLDNIDIVEDGATTYRALQIGDSTSSAESKYPLSGLDSGLAYLAIADRPFIFGDNSWMILFFARDGVITTIRLTVSPNGGE
jgi:hypothetical protein